MFIVAVAGAGVTLMIIEGLGMLGGVLAMEAWVWFWKCWMLDSII